MTAPRLYGIRRSDGTIVQEPMCVDHDRREVESQRSHDSQECIEVEIVAAGTRAALEHAAATLDHAYRWVYGSGRREAIEQARDKANEVLSRSGALDGKGEEG